MLFGNKQGSDHVLLGCQVRVSADQKLKAFNISVVFTDDVSKQHIHLENVHKLSLVLATEKLYH